MKSDEGIPIETIPDAMPTQGEIEEFKAALDRLEARVFCRPKPGKWNEQIQKEYRMRNAAKKEGKHVTDL